MRGEGIQRHIFFKVTALNDKITIIYFYTTAYYQIYIQTTNTVYLMDHNDHFQDMVSELFESRQGANVTGISQANYS